MSFQNVRAALAASVAVYAVVAASPVSAQARSFDVPAQAAVTGIPELARQADVQILVSEGIVRGKITRVVKGRMSVQQALKRLIAGTGLRIAASDGRTFTLSAIPATASPRKSMQPTPSSRDVSPATDGADAAEGSSEELAIVVTGSRIARQLITDSNVPVVGIGEEDIEASGSRELSEILADYPAVTPGSNLANSNNAINAAGVSTISLRSLGTNRTLTLIDGRRAVSNSITSSAVSYSTIPSFFVQRVEIVTGGASAVYGSDAIAGVVNVITRKSFEGVRLGSRYGLSTGGGAQRANINALAGMKFLDDRVSVIVGAEYEKEYGLMGSDRDFALESLSYNQTADANPLNNGDLGISRPSRSSSPPGGRFLSSSTAGGGYFYYDANGNLARSTSSAVYGWETRPDLQISAPRESRLAAAKLDIDLGSNIEFFSQVQFSDIDTVASRGGADTVASTEIFGLFGVDEREVGRIPRNNPFVPAAIRALAPSSGIPFQRRLPEVGKYQIVNDRDTWRAWAGLKGTVLDDWKWELSYGYGRFQQNQDRINLINFEKVQRALRAEFDPAFPNDLSRVRCIDPAARAEGCVPLNLFGLGSISPAAADYIRTTMRTRGVVRQDVVQGHVAGTVFELPAGPVSFALGGEYRNDWQNTVTDDETRRNVGSASFIAEYEGSITAKEAFLELNVPLLADIPFAERLGLDAAIRYGKYDIRNVGSVLSYRVGGEWAPFSGLRFRGQYSRAQRAPTVTNLFSPFRDDADDVADLCSGVTGASLGTVAVNCRSIPAIAAVIAANGVFTQDSEGIAGPSSGNPDLKEETADTITLGAVLMPAALPGFSMTVDYFNIKVKDAIGSLDGDDILRECLANPAGLVDNFFCGEVTRNPTTGQITRILNRDLNLNEVVRSGVDVGLEYRFRAPEWLSPTGRFDARLLYSRLLKFHTAFDGVEGERIVQSKGEIGSWVNQGQAQLGFKDDDFSILWKTRYTGKAVDSLERLAIAEAAGSNPPFLRIGDRWRHDFYVSLERPMAGRELRLYAGVNNAFNSISPFLPSGTDFGSSQNIAGEYDVVGRFLYVGAEVRF